MKLMVEDNRNINHVLVVSRARNFKAKNDVTETKFLDYLRFTLYNCYI